jgi:uncharacterized membrane protein
LKETGARLFWTYWIGFSAFFLLLQFLLNHSAGMFAIFMSILAAAPVTTIIYFSDKRRKQQG